LSERYTFGNIIGRSKPMMDVFALMEKVCSVDYPVIVEGETGTGKELVAKSIHFNSRRKDRPFIPINCAAISETILESELFGHVKGAFTGADEYKAGLFELANGGTLFLDEIEEMSPTLQRKLLRVLEDRNVRPVGAKDVISVDVRVIASTNQSVKELLAKEKLREDLYYRLATFTIYLPPLRERAEDIPLICEHLLNEISREVNGPKKTLDPDALGVLMRHPWPGNIRELRNELRKAYVLSPTDRLSPAHFSPHVNPSELTPAYEGDYARAIQQFERSMILQALEHHKGNLTHAAQALGLARNTLKAKMKQYGIRAVPNV
jgi:transcriptional regulator with PAS, ATPase and Fis domain